MKLKILNIHIIEVNDKKSSKVIDIRKFLKRYSKAQELPVACFKNSLMRSEHLEAQRR